MSEGIATDFEGQIDPEDHIIVSYAGLLLRCEYPSYSIVYLKRWWPLTESTWHTTASHDIRKPR